jgi:DNA-binding NarL/FixJ family response regulator
MRLNILQIVPHSNRNTAALSLKLGGATDKEIAFRLGWHVSSVPTYLQECFQLVGALVQTTPLQGAYQTSL